MISIDMSDVLSSTIDMSTVTMPPYSTTINTGTYTTGYNWSAGDYTITGSNGYSSDVNITSKGLDLKNDADIKIGDRSLKDFMNRVEDRLAILRPNPELEDRWDELKELRRKYESLEREILEKEKMWDILKK